MVKTVKKSCYKRNTLILLSCAQTSYQEHLLKVTVRNSHMNVTFAFVFRRWRGYFHYVFCAIKILCEKCFLEFSTPKENIATSEELEFLYSDHKTYVTYLFSFIPWLPGISVCKIKQKQLHYIINSWGIFILLSLALVFYF